MFYRLETRLFALNFREMCKPSSHKAGDMYKELTNGTHKSMKANGSKDYIIIKSYVKRKSKRRSKNVYITRNSVTVQKELDQNELNKLSSIHYCHSSLCLVIILVNILLLFLMLVFPDSFGGVVE